MPITKITNKVQTTIPEEIQKFLNLHPRDHLDFIISEDGRVYLKPTRIKVESLKGMLYQRNRRPISIEQMDASILSCVEEIWTY